MRREPNLRLISARLALRSGVKLNRCCRDSGKYRFSDGRGSCRGEAAKIPATDRAGGHFVVAGTGPMSLEAEPAVISVGHQRGDLALPIDVACTKRTPDWLVAFHMAILGMNVDDAIFGKQAVAVGERVLSSDQRVGRVPHHL